MKIAIPTAEGKLCMHFGHCETFALVDIDSEKKTIVSTESVEPPPHEPGLLPRWLAEKGVNCVIAGGMGARAVNLFEERGIKVITGAQSGAPEDIVKQFLADSLVTGANACDH